MEKSKVYYTNLRTGFNNGLLDKLKRLIKAAGIDNIDFEGKYAAEIRTPKSVCSGARCPTS